MARSTIAEDIARLEAELTALRTKISTQEAVTEMEEGGGGSRFRTGFTDITKLYQRERELVARLDTLYSYTAVSY
jgi:hypothetical protein